MRRDALRQDTWRQDLWRQYPWKILAISEHTGSSRSMERRMVRGLLYLFAVVATAATTQAAAAQAACPGNADALSTERVLVVDPATYPRGGRKPFPQTLPLKPKEVVLTFDDGPEPGSTSRVLDALKRECVRGSFFVLGRRAPPPPRPPA